ncbi:MAG: class I SAM-dependent methyltransferase [Clostridia bacterium]|nr:class I SAM-dependent methyltransferase [Clostridia bacterium]
MTTADKWRDYELIDTGDGMRLERWKDVILARPDPQVIWPKSHPEKWKSADAVYSRSSSGGGAWQFKHNIPKQWNISYDNMKFGIEPMGFKHTGLFPEQAANWDWMRNIIKAQNGRPVKVINLFAYTGGATVACAEAGAQVCHVDASKGMVAKAKENVALSGLTDRPVRYIVDDVNKFVAREIRRNSLYDGVIMDPPSYGRGTNGEVWKLEDCLYDLVKDTCGVMTEKPLFFLLNSYTTGFSAATSANILELTLVKKYGGKVKCDEIGLPVTSSGIVLPCGAYARWTK